MNLDTCIDPAGSVGRLVKAAIVFIAVCLGTSGEPAHAGQAGAQVVVGDVTFIHDGYRTIIQASDGSIIDYLRFDVLPWETIQFIQPGQWSRVLNRITGPDPTVIAGQIMSNGQVYIINPAGVYFANGSVVDVGSLYAAAGNISNEDFVANVDRFTGLTGDVVNAGVITGENIHLMGNHVANHGLVNSEGGVITMLAGDSVYLSRLGERISVRVDGQELMHQSMPHGGGAAPDMTATPGVLNTGVVRNAGGTVMFGAGDMYSMAIRNEGVVEAAGGNVTLAATSGLVQNDGILSASVLNGQAGSVVVQGPSVLNRGQITADSQNGNAGYVELTSRNHTFMTSGSLVSAAGGSGVANAGEVLVHSYDGQTIFGRGAALNISGGLLGGTGGFAEVSGQYIMYLGTTLMNAASGFEAGTLLIDPDEIIIQAGGGDPLGGDILFDPPGSGTTIIDPGVLNAFVGGTLLLQARNLIDIRDSFQMLNTALTLETMGGIIRFQAAINVQSLVANANAMGGTNGVIRFGSAGTVTSSAGQRYMSNVEIGVVGGPMATTTLTLTDTGLNSAVRFDGTVNTQGTPANLNSLIINGNADFRGDVGTGPLTGINSLAVTGNTRIGNGGAIEVRTTQTQTYNGTTEIDGAATLRSNSIGPFGTIRLVGDVTSIGASSLAVNTKGTTQFVGAVGTAGQAFTSITTDQDGATELGGDLWGDTVMLLDAVSLTNDVTVTGTGAAGSVLFGSTVTSLGIPSSLTVNALTTTFNGDVTGLNTLTTDPTGVTNLNTGVVSAINLMFGDTLVLGNMNTTLTGTAAANFAAIMGNGNNLTVTSPTTGFNGVVTNVGTLMTAGGGTTTIAADISGNVLDFNEAVALGNNATLIGTTSVDFASTIAGNGNNLTVNSLATGFNGAATNVGTLTTGGGTTTIAADISGIVLDFNDAVVLGNNAMLAGTTSVDFASTIAGNGNNLTVNSLATGFNGAVTNVGTLMTGGGTTTISADINGIMLDFNDAVALGNNVMLTGTTSVDFASTIAGNGNDLTVTSPMMAFNGAATGLGTLNALGNSSIGSDVSGTVLNFAGDVALTGNSALTGTASVDVAGTVTGNNNNLTVTSLVTGFNGDVTGVNALATNGATTFGTNVNTVSAQSMTFADAITLMGPNAKMFTALGGDATFGGITGSGADLTISGNEVFFFDAVNNVNQFMVTANAGARRILLRDAPITSAGNQVYNGNMLFETAGATPITTLMAPNVTFNGTVDSQGVAAMPSGLLVMGDAVFFGNVGAVSGILSLEITGRTTFQNSVDTVRSATTQTYGGAVVSNSPMLTMTSTGDAQIAFNDTFNAGVAGVPGSVAINTGGQTVFNGVVGGLSPFMSLTTDADGGTTIGADVFANMITLNDDVQLANSATLGSALGSSNSVFFGKTIAGNGNSLLVNSNLTTFNGNVSNLVALTTDAAGTTTVNAGVQVAANAITFNDVSTVLNDNSALTANTVNILGATTVNGLATVTGTQLVDFGGAINTGAVPANLVVNSMERVNFRGDIGTGTALTSLTVNTAGPGTGSEIVFWGDRMVVTNGGDILLNAGGRAAPTPYASIAALGSLTLNATGGGNVGIGQNEKLSALGSISLAGNTVTFGDLNTLGDLDINANTIQVWRRPAGRVATPDGSFLEDLGVDILVFGNLSFTGTPTLIGTGAGPRVIVVGNALNLGDLERLAASRASGNTLLAGLGNLFDLTLTPPPFTPTSLAEALAYDPDGQISDRTPRDIVRKLALERLAIYLRSRTNEELLASTSGTSVYMDTPITSLDQSKRLETLAPRLSARFMERVADQFAAIFYDQITDPETGDVTVTPRDEELRGILAGAWDEYNASGSTQAFRVWLEDTGTHGEALACLDDLRSLFRDVEIMGATQREQTVCMKRVCGDITPSDMTDTELIDAIRMRSSG